MPNMVLYKYLNTKYVVTSAIKGQLQFAPIRLNPYYITYKEGNCKYIYSFPFITDLETPRITTCLSMMFC